MYPNEMCPRQFFRLLRAAALSAGLAALGLAAQEAGSPDPQPAGDIRRPIDFLEWGFDFRFREEYFRNATSLSSEAPDHEFHYLRLRPRLWTSLLPATNVSVNARLIAEPRYYFAPESREGWANEEGLLDGLNLRLERFAGQPVTLTLGRQDIAFGNRWLIWDGSELDGSRTDYFDAGRVTWELAELSTTVDAICVEQAAEAGGWLPVINERNQFIREQDERAVILYVRNTSVPHTKLDGYLIWREESAVTGNGNSGRTWTAGARAEGDFRKRWHYRAEAAPQWGELNGADLRAFGFNGLVSRDLGGAWKHQVHAGYEYLSGDDPDTAANEGWDPHWARRPQWSELMVQLFGAENRGRPGDYKNLQRPNVGWTFSPERHTECTIEYAPVFANENPHGSDPNYGNGRFRGHYLQAIARVRFGEHWAAHLWGELFRPGNYYGDNRQDLAAFGRLEVIYKF